MGDPAQVPSPLPAAIVQRIVVESNVPVLDTGMFDHMVRIAKLLAASSLVPAHLNRRDKDMTEGEAVANCFLVVNQATRWRMDPFAVAQHVFVTKGRIGYEGKLVAAVINTHPLLERRLSYAFEGSGGKRKIIVTGKIKGDAEERKVDGTVDGWKTNNDSWEKIPDQMLVYRGSREWARRWIPEAILGVYADEELEFEHGRTIEPSAETASSPAGGGATDALRSALRPAATAETTDKKPAEKAGPVTAAGGDGTPERRDELVKKMKEAKTIEELDVAMMEADFMSWTKPDRDVIDGQYRVSKALLEKPAVKEPGA